MFLDSAQAGLVARGAERSRATCLIVGTGQQGNVRLSGEAEGYFARTRHRVRLLPTLEAIQAWNEAEGTVIGLFHITC